MSSVYVKDEGCVKVRALSVLLKVLGPPKEHSRFGLPRRAGNYWLLDSLTSDRDCLFRSWMFTREEGSPECA